jgi:hypothetical protein
LLGLGARAVQRQRIYHAPPPNSTTRWSNQGATSTTHASRSSGHRRRSLPRGAHAGTRGSFDEFLAAVRSETTSRLEPLLPAAGAVLLRGFPARTGADFDRDVDAFGSRFSLQLF